MPTILYALDMEWYCLLSRCTYPYHAQVWLSPMASAGSGGPTANPAWPSYVSTVTDKALSLEDLAHVPGLGSVPPKLVKKIAPFEGVYLGGWEIRTPSHSFSRGGA